MKIYNPIDGVCDPELGSICPSNTKTVGPFDNNILKNKPDVRFILSFGFHHYASTDTLDDLFSANQSSYPIFMGNYYKLNNINIIKNLIRELLIFDIVIDFKLQQKDLMLPV